LYFSISHLHSLSYKKLKKMPKIKEGIIGFSGKMGNDVFVQSNRYGPHVRKRPKPGSKKNQAAIKQNYKRTALLNSLASEVNRIIGSASEGHKHQSFYFNVQKRFRKQPLNNRFLLLHSLKGMDVHPRYTINHLAGRHDITINTQKNRFVINLRVKAHAQEQFNTNCYSYELLFLSWNKTAKPAQYDRQLSEWIYLKGPKPEFEFLFPKPTGTIHWMLCVKQKMGIDGEPGSFKAQGMHVAEVQTLDKKELALLKKITTEKNKNSRKKEQATVIRVKPKSLNS
jgi:hypothetical protein